MPGEANNMPAGKASGATEDDLVNALQEMADGSVMVGGAPATPPQDSTLEEDARLGGSHEDAEDEAAIAQGRTEEEREAIRARRREERQQRKQRSAEDQRDDQCGQWPGKCGDETGRKGGPIGP